MNLNAFDVGLASSWGFVLATPRLTSLQRIALEVKLRQVEANHLQTNRIRVLFLGNDSIRLMKYRFPFSDEIKKPYFTICLCFSL